MPIFEIEANGKSYEVDAPDVNAAMSALGIGQQPAATSGPRRPGMGIADTALDVGRSLGTGVAKGAIGLAGLPGDVADFVAMGIDKAAQAFGAEPRQTPPGRSPLGQSPIGAAAIQRGIEGVTGEFPKPKTTYGEYGQTLGEFLPAAMAGPGSLARKVGMWAAAPAVASETAGQVTKGTEYEPFARVGGALAGPAAVAGARRAITPLPIPAARQGAVAALEVEGVPLTAGQRTGSKPLQWAESSLGDMPFAGGRAAETMTQQGEAFTGAMLRRAGENANRATPDVIDGMFGRLGGQFNQIAARNDVVADRQLVQGLLDTAADYVNVVAPAARSPMVENTVREIFERLQANGGTLTGAQYQDFTTRLARAGRGAGPDQPLREAVYGIREVLDDALERGMRAAGSPDLGLLRETRNHYRNALVIERAATAAGEGAASGIISPSAARNATVNVQGRRNYARGQGDFADLTRAGEQVMKPLPQSGTAPRAFYQSIAPILGAAAGFGGAPVLPALAMAAAPSVAGRALMSNPMQAYLSNQLLAAPQMTPEMARMLLRANASAQGAASLQGRK